MVELIHEPSDDFTTEELHDLWLEFTPLFRERLAAIDAALAAYLIGPPDETARRAGQAAAHALLGSIGLFGLPTASNHARALEHALADGHTEHATENVDDLLHHAALLRHLIQQGPPATTSAPSTPPPPPQDRVRLLIIDDDQAIIRRLLHEASHAGLTAHGVESLNDAPAAIRDFAPGVVLLDLGFPEGEIAALPLLTAITRDHPSLPVLVLTSREGFSDRAQVARRGGHAYLRKSTPPERIIELALEAALRSHPLRSRILVLSDTPALAATLRGLQGAERLDVIALDDPERLWGNDPQTEADLILLDAAIRGLPGEELCRILRNDPARREVPILLMIDTPGAEVNRRALAAGADDLLVRSRCNQDLVSRITAQLRRRDTNRQLAETDHLTGLPNRRHAAREITQQLARFPLQPFVLALLDIDHFKRVNDHHGHATGDAVLRAFGQFLAQAFRAGDIVARWGGEEFLVCLYETDAPAASIRFASLLVAWQQRTFVPPSGEALQTTFSVGLAEYPRHGHRQELLLEAADNALYGAKSAGRARVHIAPSSA